MSTKKVDTSYFILAFMAVACVLCVIILTDTHSSSSSPSEQAHIVVHSLWDGQKQYFKINPKKNTHSIDFRNVFRGQESITVELNKLPSVYKFRTPVGSFEYEIYWISSTQKSQTKWMKEQGAGGPQLAPSEEERLLRQSIENLMKSQKKK